MLGSIIGAIGSVAGGFLNNAASKAAAEEAYENQKNIIQHQTSWLVKDAKRNGIHPLAVLGMNPASGPPPAQVFDSGLGEAASAVGSALERKMDPMQQLQMRASQQAIEQSMAETDLTRTQAASQRMRNIQQSTPGVRSTTGNDVQTMMNPLTGEPFNVLDKDVGQKWENYGGEGVGAAGGALGSFGDYLRLKGYSPAQIAQINDDPAGFMASQVNPWFANQYQRAMDWGSSTYQRAQDAMSSDVPYAEKPWYERIWYR